MLVGSTKTSNHRAASVTSAVTSGQTPPPTITTLGLVHSFIGSISFINNEPFALPALRSVDRVWWGEPADGPVQSDAVGDTWTASSVLAGSTASSSAWPPRRSSRTGRGWSSQTAGCSWTCLRTGDRGGHSANHSGLEDTEVTLAARLTRWKSIKHLSIVKLSETPEF